MGRLIEGNAVREGTSSEMQTLRLSWEMVSEKVQVSKLLSDAGDMQDGETP